MELREPIEPPIGKSVGGIKQEENREQLWEREIYSGKAPD
jgi:hypothetical protein